MALLALVSLFGSTVGWIVVSSEVPYQAAKNGLFPKLFAKQIKRESFKIIIDYKCDDANFLIFNDFWYCIRSL